ncbi:MAG: FemAB family PEP-CTERM system-associated protein [Gammaproteobacteria bacterium]|nr:FemAB family PEP-CTERM system-associated protein [Gammaproteobacteria bacterium]
MAWDCFARKHSELVYFQWRWREVVEAAFGHRPHYLQAKNTNGDIVAILPLFELKSVLFGHFYLSLPFVNYGGILASDKRAVEAIVGYCETMGTSSGISHLLLREDKELSCEWQCEQHKVTMLLDLPDQVDTLWSQIGSKRRAQIKRPAKEGAICRFGHIELLSDFYYVFARNMRDLGTPVYGRGWFAEILKRLDRESQLALVYLNGQPVAAGFLIRHGRRMEIPWASSLREANPFGVNMLLYWEILKWSIEQGCEVFDFGRSSKDANTYRFKKQWGSQPHQLYWYNWLPAGNALPQLDPGSSKFALAIAAWQRLPVPVANLLGPGIVKYLP